MLRPVAFLRDINEKKDFWKVAVKVTDKWSVVKDGMEHMEMVIVDAKVLWSLEFRILTFLPHL